MSDHRRGTFAQERRVRRMLGRPGGPGRPGAEPARPAAKNIPMVRALPGPVDRAALELSLRQLVARHPALHHRFTERGDDVVLEPVDLAVAPPVELESWSAPGSAPGSASGPLPADQVQALVRARADRPFDVTGWPLLRAGVIEAERPVLCVVLDHLVSDGWSLSVVARDLEALYTAACTGRPAALAAADDFTVFAATERRQFSAAAPVTAALRGVRAVLGGGPLEPGLPFDASPWDLSTPRYRQLDALTGPEADAFERRCRAGRTTVLAGALAAVGAALGRTAGVREAALLVAVHNRGVGASATGVGWYANMLPVRFPVGEGSPGPDSLRQAHRALTATLEFYDVPLARLEAVDRPPGNGTPPSVPLFVSFSDDRTAAVPAGTAGTAGTAGPTGSDGPSWSVVAAAPSYRPGYGLWISRHDDGLRLVVVSPRPATRESVLEAFESELCGALQEMASG